MSNLDAYIKSIYFKEPSRISTNFQDAQSLDFLFFWSHQQISNAITTSCLSQWYDAKFTYSGIIYRTAEHWMMSEKAKLFDDGDIFEEIVNTSTPADAKRLGRNIRNFDNKLWTEKRFDIVVKGNLLKFSQNDLLKDYLLGTGKKILVEASPYDTIWGIGLTHGDIHATEPSKWRGLNLLGFALMEVRNIL